MDTEIITGDYGAQSTNSLLAQCQRVKSNWDGMLHSGIIHFIQQKMPDFTLKAAICQVLEKCPSVWPMDLPDKIEKEEVKLTNAMKDEFANLNKGLLLPIGGYEIVQIIKLAKQFLSEHGVTN